MLKKLFKKFYGSKEETTQEQEVIANQENELETKEEEIVIENSEEVEIETKEANQTEEESTEETEKVIVEEPAKEETKAEEVIVEEPAKEESEVEEETETEETEAEEVIVEEPVHEEVITEETTNEETKAEEVITEETTNEETEAEEVIVEEPVHEEVVTEKTAKEETETEEVIAEETTNEETEAEEVIVEEPVHEEVVTEESVTEEENKFKNDQAVFLNSNDMLDDEREVSGYTARANHLRIIKEYNNEIDKNDYVQAYFRLVSIFKLFYKYRDVAEVNEQLLVNVKMQVELFKMIEEKTNYEFYRESDGWLYKDNKWSPKTIACFKNYIIVHEKNEMIQEAIDMCDLAIELGYENSDGTKMGIKGRKAKLEKMLANK